MFRSIFSGILSATIALSLTWDAMAQKTAQPVLHGKHWMAIAGKPLSATTGAGIFHDGGNAVDAACAMLAASATIHDAMSWGGETQALIYNPNTGSVIGVNALGVAPTGATPEFFQGKRMQYPPEYGPLAALTPGTPGGLLVMLAEYGTMSLEQVLEPSLELAEGYPVEQSTAYWMERAKGYLKQWPESKRTFLLNLGEAWEAPRPGQILVQDELAETLRKLVDTERAALAEGKSRKEAIYAAYDRFYTGDIAEEFVRGSRALGGLHTMEDLANWKVHLEKPVMTTYRDIEVYKLTTWVQGPALLQALNIVENADVRAMGWNSPEYIHFLYQTLSMAFADRDFYYGDPYFPPEEPIDGLLSKDYAQARYSEVNWDRNPIYVAPGDPYEFQSGENPFLDLLETHKRRARRADQMAAVDDLETHRRGFYAGTTTIQTADEEGWVVSITPSGGWMPAALAGKTGIGMSQRMQSFVLNEREGPYNVLEPGKRPRATLTPSIALKDGKPYLSFAVQGGDTQEQNLLQFFLNMVEFGMNVQEAAEAANFTNHQVRSSFGAHQMEPGKLTLHQDTPPYVARNLRDMGYQLEFEDRTSGPINAIYFDHEYGTFWGGSSHHGDDYGAAW